MLEIARAVTQVCIWKPGYVLRTIALAENVNPVKCVQSLYDSELENLVLCTRKEVALWIFAMSGCCLFSGVAARICCCCYCS